MIISNEIIYRRIMAWSVKIKDWLVNIHKERCRAMAQKAERKRQAKFWRQLNEARSEWELAVKMQNEYTDETLIDFGAYNIKASELKFRYLNNLARREGFKLTDDTMINK